MCSRWLPHCRRSGGTIASGDCFFWQSLLRQFLLDCSRYTLCDGSGQAALLFLEHVHVVSAAPRILAASTNARYCRIFALVLHIPTFKAKLAACQSVYDDASLILQSCARSARHVFVFFYFNGTVGKFASPGIGTWCGAAPLDAGGELLANFMVRWSLSVLATFDSCQQGPNATWTYSIGRSSRKDLVLCSADLQMGVPPIGLTRPLIFLQKKVDHSPSALQGSFSWPQTPAAVVRRPVHVRRSELADPIRLQQFLADVGTCSVPDWHVDVHAHCGALAAVLRSALAGLRIASHLPRNQRSLRL